MREAAFEAASPSDDGHTGSGAVAQTLDQFIAGVIDAARNRADFDATLLAILTNYIVKEDPADNPVALAVAQIEALAESRAVSAKQESPDGGDNA
jgi:hypothetical protein